MDDNEEIENYGSEGSWFSGIVGWIIGFAVLFWIVGLFTPTKYEGQTAKNWFDEYDQCSADLQNSNTKLEEYKTALTEANSNIEDANSFSIYDANRKIKDAQYCSYGCSYDEMQNLINDLKKIDEIQTVTEPY